MLDPSTISAASAESSASDDLRGRAERAAIARLLPWLRDALADGYDAPGGSPATPLGHEGDRPAPPRTYTREPNTERQLPFAQTAPKRGSSAAAQGVRRAQAKTGTVSFGLNNGKTVYAPSSSPTLDDEYGSIASSVASWKDLGAAFVRQPGETDLMFPPQSSTGRPPPLPLEANLATDIETYIKPGIKALFTALCSDDEAPAVVLTLLTLGGAVDGIQDTDTPFPDVPFSSVVPADFRDHFAASIVDPSDARATYTLGGNPGDDDFRAYYCSTLDFSDPYKLAWVHRFAQEIGKMMVIVAGELSSELGRTIDPTTFAGRLLGIELFNEVNTGNRISGDEEGLDSEAMALYWARGVARAAMGLREGYAAVERSTLPPALWLPSLASENNNQTWAGFTNAFHWALVDGVFREVHALGGSDAEMSLFTNQDVHFYRFNARQGTHLATTMIDVVRGMIANLGTAGYDAEVSVCETGASVAGQSGGQGNVFPGWVTDAIASGADEADTRETFQAMEVVRRLVVAAASGATRVAWNSHIGLTAESSAFYGTGLREDLDAGVSANEKRARKSYGAYRRLVEFFHTYGLRASRVVLPRPAGAYIDLDLGDSRNGPTVVQFEISPPPTAGGPWVWFVFFDSAVEGVATLTVSTAADGVYTRATIVPTSIASQDASRLADDELPLVEEIAWNYWVATALPAGSIYPELASGDEPTMWFSKEDLIFGAS